VRSRSTVGKEHAFEWCAEVPEAEQSMDEISDFFRERM
jgi:hypothetical protein